MTKRKANIKHNSTYLEKNVKKEGYVRIFFLVILSAILFFPPFLRGLFFEKEQFVVETFVFAVFILFWIYKLIKKDRSFLRTPIEVASLGLLLLYLISIIYAVSTRDAISEWLKYCMYFSIFFMLSELLTTFKLRRAFLWFVSGVAVLLCLVGIDGAAGATVTNGINQVLKSMGAQNDLFFGVFVGNRIFSSLQYPNALASYVMAAFIIMTGLGATYTNKWVKGISSAMGSLFFLTFILTLSRGAYILFPVAVLILIIILPKGGRIRTFAFGLIPILAAVPFSLIISRFMGEQTLEGKKVWALTFSCMAVAGIATFAYSYISAGLEKISWKVYLSVFAGLVILGGIGAVIVVNSDSPLALEHTASQPDSDTYLQKSINLKPDKDYTLQLELDASSSVDKPYTYQIVIDSKNMKDILSSGQKQIALFTDKNTAGAAVKNIDFTVPEDSEEVLITFRNYYQSSKVTLDNAVIIDKDTKNIVKRLKLNYKYIPEAIAQRFENLGADQSNIQRQVYFKDAEKMIKDRWFLGGGGKAWEKLYYSYQSFGYSSTQAHNYFLQVAVEVGIVGILLVIMLVCSIIYLYFKRQGQAGLDERLLQASLLTAIISMLAHSAIDFDFSLSAVFLLLWQLLAVYNSSYRQRLDPIKGGKNTGLTAPTSKLPTGIAVRIYKIRPQPIIAIIVLAVVIYFPIALGSARSSAEAYDKYAKANKVNLAVGEIKKAVKLDPLNSQYNIKYLNYLLTKKNITNAEMEQVADLTERVEKSSTYDANLATNYAGSLLSTGNINKGMEYMDKAIQLRPHYLVQWKTKVNACYQIAVQRLTAGDLQNARIYADKGIAVIEEARQANKLSMVPFVADEEMIDNLEKLMYIKDNNTKKDKSLDIKTILFYNIPRMDINNDNIPDQWTTDNASQGSIQSRPMDFEAGKKYQIEVKLQKVNSTDKIPFTITGVMGGNELLQYKDGRYSAAVKLGDKPVTGALRLELPDGCVVEEVLVRKNS